MVEAQVLYLQTKVVNQTKSSRTVFFFIKMVKSSSVIIYWDPEN